MDEQKSLENVVSAIASSLELLNFQPPSRTATVWARILHSMAVYMLCQSVVIIFVGWHCWDFGSRIAAIESLAFLFGMHSISADLFFLSNRNLRIITMLQSRYYSPIDCYSETGREKRSEIIKTMDQTSVYGAVILDKILKSIFIGYLILPLLSIVFYYLNISKIEDLRLPLIIYLPDIYPISQSFSSIHNFLVAFCFNLMCGIYNYIMNQAAFKLLLLSVDNVLNEMKLFHLNFEELNLVLEDEEEEDFEKYKRLRNMMRHVVRQHQLIFRKVDILNSGLKYRLFAFNAYTCMQTCLSIFSFMKGDFTFKRKLGVVIFAIVVNIYCFFISDLGQKLHDEGERIRHKLIYGCNWLKKPNWMNKTLIILMIRSNQLPKLDLFNVFILNRNNFKVIVQGAYSYFNILKNVSN